jgi:GR25 family glycosyltransferase involved in LPS biosynthesis
MEINNIYCINLDKRPDRWTKMLIRFKKYNLNVTRVSAVSIEDEEAKIFSKETGIQLTNSLCCAMSHIKVLKLAKENGYKTVFILEDDIMFIESFLDKLYKSINQQHTFKLLMLDSCSNIWDTTIGIQKINNHILAGAYIINIDYINIAIDMFSNVKDWFLDVNIGLFEFILCKLQNYNESYTVYPKLCIQENEDSDISENYKYIKTWLVKNIDMTQYS